MTCYLTICKWSIIWKLIKMKVGTSRLNWEWLTKNLKIYHMINQVLIFGQKKKTNVILRITKNQAVILILKTLMMTYWSLKTDHTIWITIQNCLRNTSRKTMYTNCNNWDTKKKRLTTIQEWKHLSFMVVFCKLHINSNFRKTLKNSLKKENNIQL